MILVFPAFIMLLVLIICGIPVVVSLGLSAAMWVLVSGQASDAISSSYYQAINNFVQLAVPFFVLSGEIMNRTGITGCLIDFCQMLIGRIRGGLAYAVVLSSMIFAGITGAGVADVSALGTVFIPSMEKKGYNRVWSAALVAGAAVIGPTIPPSIITVIYGAVTGVSIGGLLIGCTIPGILMGFLMMLYVGIISKKRDFPRDTTKYTVKEAVKISINASLALIMPLIIIGGILSGLFTPTEAACVAVFYALFVGAVAFRSLKLKDIYESFGATVKISANMLMLMAAGGILSWMLAKSGAPMALAHWLLSTTQNTYLIFAFGMVIAFFLGCFMDNGVACILAAPILAPIAKAAGIDPIHFGVVMIITLNIGLITPPFGMNMFTAAVVGKVKFDDIIPEIWPYIILTGITAIMVVFFPQMTLWLPRLAGLI